MKAVILAGGQGSRLRPLSAQVPKPMIHVLGRPMMEHIVKHLASFGVQDIVNTLHFKPRVIRDFFQDGSEFGVRMHYTLEKEPLGTAGSVKLGQHLLDETFIVVAGDALVDFDFLAFYVAHKKSGAKVSLCLKQVSDPGEFGIVITDEENYVQRFLEKPGPSEVFSDTVNTGIYIIEPEVLDEIPENKSYDFAQDLFPALLEKGINIYGHVAEGYWSDIGTLDQLKSAQWDFLSGKVNLPLDGHLLRENVWTGDGVSIHESAEIQAPVWLGDNVIVRKGARLGPNVILGDNVEIDRFATLSRSIVNQNSFIGERVDLRDCIVATRNIIEADSEVGADAVVGSACDVGRHVSIKPGVLVWPNREIDSHATVMENMVWDSLTRPSIFGSRGISGLGNLSITPEFSAMVGKAFGSLVKKDGKVSVSRDRHPFSVLIKRALVSGLLSVGVDVDDLEESTAPITRFITSHGRNYHGGIHISQSALHSQVAQIELYDGQGLPLMRETRRKVEAALHRGDFPRLSMDLVGTLQYRGRVMERYKDYLTSDIDVDAIARSNTKVAFHCPNRVTSRLMSEIFESICADYIEYGAGSDKGRDEIERQLTETTRLNNSVGAIIHHDAEQLILVDETGTVIQPDRVHELLLSAFIEDAPMGVPAIITAEQPRYVHDLAEKHDRKVITARNEPAALLHEVNLQVGSDTGWIEFSHFYLGFDAVISAVRLLEYLATTGTTLSELNRKTPISYRKSLTISCPWEKMGAVMRELSNHDGCDLEAAPEGVLLRLVDGTAFVLPSADEAELIVYIEAERSMHLNKLSDDVNRMLSRLI